jgi:site-specific DNA-methyltransferase (adenine-specific)
MYGHDCREVLAAMADESVDMIWTDPPYGHSNHDGDWNARLNEHRGIEGRPIANDDAQGMREVVDAMLREAARVLKHDCCCCCCCCCGGGGPKPTFAWLAQRMDTAGLSFFHSVIWDKVNPGLGWRYRRQHEMVMVAHRSGGRLSWNEEHPAQPNIIACSKPRGGVHPNEKPVELVQRFVVAHAAPDALVMDPFAGSGTTGVACIRSGRRFVGCEIDPKFFNEAVARMEVELRQSVFSFA